MGMLVGGFADVGFDGVSYNLDGETGITETLDPPGLARAGVRINSDGTVDKRVGGTYTQIDSGTDWVIPNNADKTNVRFRCTNNGDTLAPGSSATGSWLSATCEWWVEEANPEGTSILDIDIEISLDTGTSTHDTGTYEGAANINPL